MGYRCPQFSKRNSGGWCVVRCWRRTRAAGGSGDEIFIPERRTYIPIFNGSKVTNISCWVGRRCSVFHKITIIYTFTGFFVRWTRWHDLWLFINKGIAKPLRISVSLNHITKTASTYNIRVSNMLWKGEDGREAMMKNRQAYRVAHVRIFLIFCIPKSYFHNISDTTTPMIIYILCYVFLISHTMAWAIHFTCIIDRKWRNNVMEYNYAAKLHRIILTTPKWKVVGGYNTLREISRHQV